MTACQALAGPTLCLAEPARPYTVGYRCEAHTPARMAGRQDVEPPFEGSMAVFLTRAGKSALIDDRAVASGKSRRGAHAYREARMREDERRERELAARKREAT